MKENIILTPVHTGATRGVSGKPHVKAMLGTIFRAPYDFKPAKVSKMHGTVITVNGVFALIGFCML